MKVAALLLICVSSALATYSVPVVNHMPSYSNPIYTGAVSGHTSVMQTQPTYQHMGTFGSPGIANNAGFVARVNSAPLSTSSFSYGPSYSAMAPAARVGYTGSSLSAFAAPSFSSFTPSISAPSFSSFTPSISTPSFSSIAAPTFSSYAPSYSAMTSPAYPSIATPQYSSIATPQYSSFAPSYSSYTPGMALSAAPVGTGMGYTMNAAMPYMAGSAMAPGYNFNSGISGFNSAMPYMAGSAMAPGYNFNSGISAFNSAMPFVGGAGAGSSFGGAGAIGPVEMIGDTAGAAGFAGSAGAGFGAQGLFSAGAGAAGVGMQRSVFGSPGFYQNPGMISGMNQFAYGGPMTMNYGGAY
ncbi:DNA-directed RNA polymerase II subunit 1-like isoform X3 [Pecten maximus]|uniref:DNA-directed RNA polymerase II subunit 1-like isoform X3 n=1 Tax=Pecten maximus TaxID=6579 RepID=UPI001458D0B1|nr:DNA-directed RNA polymerase II subunit 1-like isoform X3 [Pecten maximus]